MSITNNVARAKTDYDEVYEAGKQSVYETITITQDCTNIKQICDIFDSVVSADEMVLFVNDAWVGLPDANTPNNLFLMMLWTNTGYSKTTGTRECLWGRWRGGAYATTTFINTEYDCVLPSGSTLRKVVIR